MNAEPIKLEKIKSQTETSNLDRLNVAGEQHGAKWPKCYFFKSAYSKFDYAHNL